MTISSSAAASAPTRRVLLAGTTGAALGLAVGLVLTAGNPASFLLALAGMAIAATLAQGIPEPAESRADRRRLSSLEPPANPAPAWLPDPLGGEHERLWDGETWTRHVWRGR
ncbi:DUF2510 domain-containing protein [Solirubrobacter phytolaccae]|uniref:DUF2510 domain-containing protein n=1 Tax=Solirubrobacter phytolaccae TaxID=1404360 RepID=A0A9X3SCK9_9ACTN|nr:DUF2510 domain-containing protein [Solirubrobacter phytolaccae]MDA0184821.1 DUF2510 domain-containing protein [Solirubrobacter phytolaccae]